MNSDDDADDMESTVTALRFSGGEVIEVALSLQEVRELLQRALAQGALLELQAPDGEVLVINPQQVQLLQDSAAHVANDSTEPVKAPA